MNPTDDRAGEVSRPAEPAAERGAPNPDPVVDLDRRRNLLRLAGLGLGFVALGSHNLAHGFLRRPAITGVRPKTCTSTTSTATSGSGTYTRITSNSWTETADPSCTGTGSYTTPVGEPGITTETAEVPWSGPPPQTLTVYRTYTRDNDPDFTLTISTTCQDGTISKSWTSTVTAASYSEGQTATASYTYTCGWWPFESRPPAEVEVPRGLLGNDFEFDHLDQPVPVLSSSSRGGRLRRSVSDL